MGDCNVLSVSVPALTSLSMLVRESIQTLTGPDDMKLPFSHLFVFVN